ncbi:hypothetical protein KEM54_001621 [Ascosphaera aggregata]|nr:hypothetical protein KEM54_001621 [Ascosphaera aggregata]
MKFSTLIAGALPALFSLASAHIPHFDDGSHTMMSNAWTWPDNKISRYYMMEFDCPSKVTYTKVHINDTSTPLAMSMGIPNVTTIQDYRPSVWVIGKNLVKPKEYTDVDADETAAPLSPIPAPPVPRGFTAVEYPSQGSSYWWGMEHGGTSFWVFLRWNITVSKPGDVWVAVQPTEHRRARAWLAMGRTERPQMNETGRSTPLELEAFHRPWPRLGESCKPWTM